MNDDLRFRRVPIIRIVPLKGIKGDDGKPSSPYFDYISKINKYLYRIKYSNLNYEYAKDYFKNANVPNLPFSCTSVKDGEQLGRNLDWYFSNDVDFVISTGDTLGVSGGSDHFNYEYVSNINNRSDEIWQIVPFILQDAINVYGVHANVNVVINEYNESKVVTPLIEELEEINSIMLVRYIVDNFKTATEAVNYIRDYVKVYSTLNEFDVHLMVGDIENNYVIEFINGRTHISEHNILSNFYWEGVTTNPDGTLYSPKDSPEHIPSVENGLASYSSGVERYNIACQYTGTMRDLMNSLMFSHTYTNSSNLWLSEAVGDNLTIDSPPQLFEHAFSVMRDWWEHRNRNERKVWHTTHSCIYNISNKTMKIVSQDGDDSIPKVEYTFSLIGSSGGSGTNDYNDLINKPTKLSQFTNDQGFINNNTDNLINYYDKTSIDDLLDDKVDKEQGKGLSTNDYTTDDKNKLSLIEDEANKTVVVQSTGQSTTSVMSQKAVTDAIIAGGGVEVTQTTGQSTTAVMSQKAVTDNLSLKANLADLSDVATSGSYNDLSNKPTNLSQFTNDSGFVTDQANNLENYYNKSSIDSLLSDKVDTEVGKGLSTNDYTTQEKTKLSNIEDEANKTIIVQSTGQSASSVMSQKAVTDAIEDSIIDIVQSTGQSLTSVMSQKAVTDAINSGGVEIVQSTGQSTTSVMSQKAVTDNLSLKANSSDLSNVATSGSYNDLSNTPTSLSQFTNDLDLISSSDLEQSTGQSTSSAMSQKAITDELESKASTQTFNSSLIATDWVGASAPYTQTINIDGILSTDNPIVDVVLDNSTSTAIDQLDSWSCVSDISTAQGSITATCFESKPTTTIPIQLKIVR